MPHRSAVTGEYVTDQYAFEHPDTTVYERNPMSHPEDDPTAVEPDESTLPPKPPIEDMPSGDEDPPAEETDVPEEDFATDPDSDDTIDNEEAEEQPLEASQLPEGATAQDYDDEEVD